MGEHRERKRSFRKIGGITGAVVIGLLIGLVVSGMLIFRSFRGTEPHDPVQAEQALEERTPAEVAESREMVEELEEEIDSLTTPPPEEEPPPATTAPEGEGQQVDDQEGTPVEGEVEEQLLVPNAHSPGLPDEMFNAVVLIGADASGYLADSIILVLFPEGGSAPALVSIPRDLYLYNFCSDDYRRVNANLGGCTGYANGPELLSLSIEEYTGIEVDHYVRVNFQGFVELVDGLGGIEICFDHPTYDEKAGLDITEPSCRTDGATALAYARSRDATQLVDGEWQRAWSSDFSRQQHQRELLLKLAGQLRGSSLVTLLSSLQSLSHTFKLDSGWSLTEAVEWIWRYHALDTSQVAQLRIVAEDHRTPEGAQVLLPSEPFNDVLSRWWGAAQR